MISLESEVGEAVAEEEEEEVEDKEEGQMNFLQRMKVRDSREVKAGLLSGGGTSGRKGKKNSQASGKQNPIEELNCSKEMKQFIRGEYEREKKLYSDYPETQVANSVIHRFKTHLANSKAGNNKQPSKERNEPALDPPSDADSEVSISEFDESDLLPPKEGSFSLSPSPGLLGKSRNLLVRFTTDGESDAITNRKSDLVLRRYNLSRETSPVPEVNANTKPGSGQKSKKSPGMEKRKVIEVSPRKARAKRNKAEQAEPDTRHCPVMASPSYSRGTDMQGDARVRKSVTINSQPEFFPNVTDEIYEEKEPEVEASSDFQPKSILKNKFLQSQNVSGDSKEEQDSGSGSPVKAQVRFSQASCSQSTDGGKLSDEGFDLLMKDMEKIHNSPNISLEEQNEEIEDLKITNLLTGRLCGGCEGAREVSDLSLCSVCQTVAYCDADCQRADWTSHRILCGMFLGLTLPEKKHIYRTIFEPNPADVENNIAGQTPEKDVRTPETSPTLVNSIRTQSEKRLEKKRSLPSLGRRATPFKSERDDGPISMAEGFGLPRKLIFQDFDVEDEVYEEEEGVQVSSSSSLDMFADSSPEEEAPARPPCIGVLSDSQSSKVRGER